MGYIDKTYDFSKKEKLWHSFRSPLRSSLTSLALCINTTAFLFFFFLA